ncbi:bile acid:sodium symporter family protein [Aestuariibaculum suncheonense]|uniref:Bile acid:sodium symporter n=1 Tax=Aestuariibaculum suncheonense TaxID=1028745 RepID=A0A8J6QA91_9FLAO|nr:bile acid:sodium symporter family protein [Aestuariibaculum suncheonense]MBD0835990.1 bile acid:sodium symporter [Aestuariibaculum suncheonense]
MKIDRFVVAIIVTIALAYFFPQLGSKNSSVPLDLIGSIGISFIFFFYGLKLSPEKIKHGLKNWKLHVLIQLTTFLLFPIIIILFKGFIKVEEGQMLWLSFLFLAALPSTVSSSVVMVSMAKGNIPAAIFNASISGLIGIVITPLWMGLFSKFTATDFNLGEIYMKLLLEILAPVILGILLQKYGQTFVKKYQHQLPLFDKSVILLIIYKSYAHSFEDGVFNSLNLLDLSMVFTAVVILFYSVYFLTGFLSKKLGFNKEDKITAQFCGTKKSLVHGTVFSKILFPSTMPLGLILLPLMLFHALQIFIISIIATKLAKREIVTT